MFKCIADRREKGLTHGILTTEKDGIDDLETACMELEVLEEAICSLAAELVTGTAVEEEQEDPSICAVAFSPDGSIVATASSVEEVAHLWDVRTSSLKAELVGHRAGIRTIAFDPSGEL